MPCGLLDKRTGGFLRRGTGRAPSSAAYRGERRGVNIFCTKKFHPYCQAAQDPDSLSSTEFISKSSNIPVLKSSFIFDRAFLEGFGLDSVVVILRFSLEHKALPILYCRVFVYDLTSININVIIFFSNMAGCSTAWVELPAKMKTKK
jgi:hypothetical protein